MTHKRSNFDGKKLELLRDAKRFFWLLLIVFGILQITFGFSRIKGNSMLPTLHPGELVCYSRFDHSFQSGDIVSVRIPSGDYYVKRIIATEGDVVDIQDGTVYVNGNPLFEPYAQGITEGHSLSISYPYTVEAGRYFVLGDNREVSEDSRAFGTVSIQQMKGKLLLAFENFRFISLP